MAPKKAAKRSKVAKTSKRAKVARASKSPEPTEQEDSETTEEVSEPGDPEALGAMTKAKRRRRSPPPVDRRPAKKAKPTPKAVKPTLKDDKDRPSKIVERQGTKIQPEPVDDLAGPDQIEVVSDMKAFEADLKNSYVKRLAEARAKNAKKPVKRARATWSYKGPKPLNDISKLPKGWTWDEPDLDEDDIDAQVKRCEERIAEQIMPRFFEHRLKGYKAAQKIRDDMAVGEKGKYSKDVIQRISVLRDIEKAIESKEFPDKNKQLPNVKALLKAYRSHELDWYGDDLVTYWSNGKRLCEPRPLNWAEFQALARKHEGWKSFWVEGYKTGVRLCNVDMPNIVMDHVGAPPGPPTLAKGTPTGAPAPLPGHSTTHAWWVALDFLHDTGAEVMQIWDTDIDLMMAMDVNPTTNFPFTTGIHTMFNIRGDPTMRDGILLLACVLDENNLDAVGVQRRLTHWTHVPAAVETGGFIPSHTQRTDGPWIRKALYGATMPNADQFRIWANTRNALKLLSGQAYPNPEPAGVNLGVWPPMREWIRGYGMDITPAGLANIAPIPPNLFKMMPETVDHTVAEHSPSHNTMANTKFKPNTKPPEPRNHRHFDPWQSASTGHQRIEGGSFLGSTPWREARSSKLTQQYKSGDCLPQRRESDTTLVPGAFDGKCGPESPPQAPGEWTMLNEEDAKRNQLGVRDIRSFMGVGKRKAVDDQDDQVKRVKGPGKEISAPVKDVTPARVESEPQSGNASLDLASTSDIFARVTVFINGSTLPQISEYKLKHLLASNGARTSIYMARKTVTHVIIGNPNTGSSGAGGGLSARKLQQEIARGGWKGVRIVSVDWAIESMKAGRRLAESRFPGMHVASKGQRSIAGMFGAK
ncbi:unnamed protein product [Penicillium olsonii]|uniref:BRCT domain-containing protein n=1 Tax=Penicillium olsonii TaxID=99116 RepID=A0A9W4MJK9_PENOL|nr:unnamed protein product [Penicillium olsonii]